MQISFQPLVQLLDVDNLITLFTAVLLERRILLRSNKYVSVRLLHFPFLVLSNDYQSDAVFTCLHL